LELNHFII